MFILSEFLFIPFDLCTFCCKFLHQVYHYKTYPFSLYSILSIFYSVYFSLLLLISTSLFTISTISLIDLMFIFDNKEDRHFLFEHFILTFRFQLMVMMVRITLEDVQPQRLTSKYVYPFVCM